MYESLLFALIVIVAFSFTFTFGMTVSLLTGMVKYHKATSKTTSELKEMLSPAPTWSSSSTRTYRLKRPGAPPAPK